MAVTTLYRHRSSYRISMATALFIICRFIQTKFIRIWYSRIIFPKFSLSLFWFKVAIIRTFVTTCTRSKGKSHFFLSLHFRDFAINKLTHTHSTQFTVSLFEQNQFLFRRCLYLYFTVTFSLDDFYLYFDILIAWFILIRTGTLTVRYATRDIGIDQQW